jgi:hypothetical protein
MMISEAEAEITPVALVAAIRAEEKRSNGAQVQKSLGGDNGAAGKRSSLRNAGNTQSAEISHQLSPIADLENPFALSL